MTRTPPDFALRRARNGFWEPCIVAQAPTADGEYDSVCWQDRCRRCDEQRTLNVLGVCRACNFRDKLPSIAVHAEPWALKEVRRRYGVSGESDAADRERKRRREEQEAERAAVRLHHADLAEEAV